MLTSTHLLLAAGFALVQLVVILRALLVDGRDPMSRAAWVLALLLVPVVGVVAYLLVGEPRLTRRLRHRSLAAADRLVAPARQACRAAEAPRDAIPDRFRAAFRLCEALSGLPAVTGNAATLAPDSNAAVDAIVAAIEGATETVHISFYIWLADINGLKVVEALCRAARRGVTCRVMADGLGSRTLVRSGHWSKMRAAGVRLQSALPIARGSIAFLGNRVDLRNHRKIVVIDNRLTFCGSQNCADPEFRVKPRFAPWVDVMLSFEGPVVLENQLLFASDWMAETGEDMTPLFAAPLAAPDPGGFPAIAFGTGPDSPKGAMADVFIALLGAAEREMVVSTPYFVPDSPLLAAVVACARRGVDTRLILPARNDSWAVGAISRAYYPQLLAAGVRIFEFHGGLLHAKTLVADGTAVLVGSANMDRRSIDLNFENNILLCAEGVARDLRERQNDYLRHATEILPDSLGRRSVSRRLWENTLTMFSPLL
ncbi:cardiolipin synthase [Roseomonas sp. JC162]|uniref:Cardiolipin synthase n=1 Tax=Neoroseomonas marina TaxID=1232220 RepID=A0A848EC83_9PROT|nr:cardiolipin synthase [Neoroseomonas marina]NMJ41070.1 cardiolipin synthase [Neoroseomonas marina]